MTFIKKYKSEIIIFIAAFVVRIALFLISLNNSGWDFDSVTGGADGYSTIANNFVNGMGYSMSASAPFLPDSLRMPLYPLFLSLFFYFKIYFAAAISQIFIGSVIPVIGYKIAHKMVSKKIAFISAVALALEPFTAQMSYVFMTETLFTFFFLLSIIFLFKYFEKNSFKNISIFGLFFGLATFTRPTIQYLPILIILIILWAFRKTLNKKTMLQSLVFLIIFLAMLTPWFYRNYAVFGSIGLTTQTGFNLISYLAPSSIALDNNQNFLNTKINLFEKEKISINDINFKDASLLKDLSLKIIALHPSGLIKTAAMTLIQFFIHDRYLNTFQAIGYFKNTDTAITIPSILAQLSKNPQLFMTSLKNLIFSEKIIFVMARLLWILITVAFFYGIYSYYRNNGLTPNLLSILAIVAYFALTSIIIGFGITGRLRIPINIFIFTFAFYGLFKKRLFDPIN